MSDGSALAEHTIDEGPAALEGETSVTVRHEDLRFGEDGYLHCTGGLRSSSTVTNLQAEYT
jgi:hypothetical protein